MEVHETWPRHYFEDRISPGLFGLLPCVLYQILYQTHSKNQIKLMRLFGSDFVKADHTFSTTVNSWSLDYLDESRWLVDLSHTRAFQESIIALLLHVLPKVEKLDMDLPSCVGTYFLEWIIGRATRRESPFDIQSPFEALTVIVHPHGLSNVWSLRFMALLLKLPAIEVISGRFGKYLDLNFLDKYVNGEDNDLKELDSSSSSLTSLNLTGHFIRRADLAHILRTPKALKTFSYFLSTSDLQDMLVVIRESLAQHEHCLESLGIDCHPILIDHISMPKDGMTWFYSFNALKIIKTPACLLETRGTNDSSFLTDTFPPSLETLHLTHFRPYLDDFLEALEDLLARKSQQQIPSLTKLIIEEAKSFDFDGIETLKLKDVLWRDTQEPAIERLSRVAATHGVSVYVTHC